MTAPHTAGGARYVTPLRYPGGKARLGPWLAQLMRHNRISGGWYVEPYAGGAGAALFLLTRGYVDHIVINDLDPVVHAFWWAVLNDTEALLALLAETPVTLESWERQRGIHASPDAHSLTQLGFATFFLNRTNRSGILTGGVIGGRDQTGPYMLDARFNKDELARRIRRIASLRRHISLYREDALDLIDGIEAELPARSLTYLDPPYYHKANRLYRNHYKPDDHARIAEAVVQIRTPWVVTYDNCTEIREIYKGVSSTEFSLHYSTSKQRPRATEVMFYGNLELQAEPSLTKGC
ncbi:MAG: DNA adenine methylase [Thauera sp.]|nr:DNA adenine methylase [Thauera sp.]MBP7639221.1 DNA adenine methylase [Thauera sp.]